MEYLNFLYQKLLLLKPNEDDLSLQTLYAVMFMMAFLASMYKASQRRELFTNFIVIACVCFNFLISAWMVQLALDYASKSNNVANAQHIYLGFIILNSLTWSLMYSLHIRFAFVFGELYSAVNRILMLMSLVHFLLWLKLVPMNLQMVYVELHYAYSFIISYLSLALGFIMMFPNTLKTKVRKVATLSFS
jgi:hypothetical protein